MPPSVEKIQLNIFLSVDLAARLDNLSAAYGKSGRAKVAVEIIEQCVDVYEQSEIAKYKVLRRHETRTRSDADEE